MSENILSPMPGTIVKILVNIGDEVMEDQDVIVLEAMKMENMILAPVDGKVKDIKVKVHDAVATHQLLMEIE